MDWFAVGAIAWMGLLFGIGVWSRRKSVARSEGGFDTVASAIGFEAHQVTPKPPDHLVDVSQQNLPGFGSFARMAMSLSFPGMSGVWNGVRITVWETVERNSYKRTYYRANLEIPNPTFIIRKGKHPVGTLASSSEPPLVKLGSGAFAKALKVRGNDVAALDRYLTNERQQEMASVAEHWPRFEITNYGIELGTRRRFSGDPAEVGRRLDAVAALAKQMVISSPQDFRPSVEPEAEF